MATSRVTHPFVPGQRFGRLTVLEEVWEVRQYSSGRTEKNRFWICLCDCGNKTKAAARMVARGNTSSCSCLHKEQLANRNRIHGLRQRPEYKIWQDMRRRCDDPARPGYKWYGARGIKICERWQSFKHFFEDMGPRPSADHSIDRIDNEGHYEPGNCRWATASEQVKNRRPYLQCPNGHPYEPGTPIDCRGKRRCPICKAVKADRVNARRRAAHAAKQQAINSTGCSAECHSPGPADAPLQHRLLL